LKLASGERVSARSIVLIHIAKDVIQRSVADVLLEELSFDGRIDRLLRLALAAIKR
jgi:hypothetical protein